MVHTHKFENILQWNCNGLKYHYPDFQLILNEYLPFAVCLQETHFLPSDKFNVRGYNIFRCDGPPAGCARGGVAILTKENLSTSQLVLNTNLQAVAVTISAPMHVTLCSLYLPQDPLITQDMILDLIGQLQSPFLLTGDFNAHNPIWGSSSIDARGRIIDRILMNNDITYLNTGDGTYFNSRSQTFSCIDLTLCSPQLASKFHWSPLSNLYNSDHFPILISSSIPISKSSRPKRWKIAQANWKSFLENLNLFQISDDPSSNISKFTNSVTTAAISAIPRTTGKIRRKSVPWWNSRVAESIKIKNQAFQKFKKYPTLENMMEFKQCRAISKRCVLESKRESWQRYIFKHNV